MTAVVFVEEWATTDVIKWQEERRSLSENESIIKQSSLYKT